MPTTSVRSSMASWMARESATGWAATERDEWETISSAEYRSSIAGLNTWTGMRAIAARVTRRISSSLLPENIGPQMTSIHPLEPRCQYIGEMVARRGGAVHGGRLVCPAARQRLLRAVWGAMCGGDPMVRDGGSSGRF